MNPIKNLCLLRLSAIGDVCHALALVQTIQRHQPQIEITWIIGKTESALVQDCKGIDWIVFDKKGGIKAYWKLYQILRKKKFDCLLLMQLSLRAHLISLFVRAKRRIGFDRDRAKEGHLYFIHESIAPQKNAHVLDGFLQFAKNLSIPIEKPIWSIPLPEKARAFAKQYIKADQKTLIINPASSVSSRNWTIEGYAGLADYAIKKHQMQVIFTGSPHQNEQILAQAIENTMKEKALFLVGKTSLKELLAFIEAADLILAPDTGPLHMAAMFNKPAIGLYAATDPRRAGPYYSNHYTVNYYEKAIALFLNKTLDTIPFGQRIHDPHVMQIITLDAVKAQLDQVLAQTHTRH